MFWNGKRERLLREAAIWFERMHGESVSFDDVASWERWLMRSAAHRRAFRAIQEVCRIVDRLREARRPRSN